MTSGSVLYHVDVFVAQLSFDRLESLAPAGGSAVKDEAEAGLDFSCATKILIRYSA